MEKKYLIIRDYDLLLAKLHAYGFTNKSIRFIKSYLTNHWQRTKVNTSFSSSSELLLGVPQESVLGPLLFNIYLNDLLYLTNVLMYATMRMTLPFMLVTQI